MTHSQAIGFSLALFLLVFLSGFFSMAETALMAVNRYRLRHQARLKKRYAILILKLLKRPDRLLGMILIGNSLSSIVASALATMFAIHYLGEEGVILSTLALTFVILIFAEIAPKTIAALFPDRVSKTLVFPVYILLMIFYPFVWVINMITNGLLRLFHIRVGSRQQESLSREELRSVVYDTAGKMSRQYQSMLLGILDLNKIMVDDVMIPYHEIRGIDIEQPWPKIQNELSTSPHDWLPVYKDEINHLLGVLHLRELTALYMSGKAFDKEILLKKVKEAYFVPEGTPLNTQLLNFQQKRKRLAFVVDEYGEIRGLVTLEDILEEIVGEFTTNVISNNKVEAQQDGSFIVDAAVKIRDLNRVTRWNFPTKDSRTLSGLIIEHLQALPHPGTCVKISGYPVEIVTVKEKRVAVAHIFPRASEPDLS